MDEPGLEARTARHLAQDGTDLHEIRARADHAGDSKCFHYLYPHSHAGKQFSRAADAWPAQQRCAPAAKDAIEARAFLDEFLELRARSGSFGLRVGRRRGGLPETGVKALLRDFIPCSFRSFGHNTENIMPGAV